MSLSLVLALIWLIAANLRAMFPSKDHLWKFAYGMIAIGIPILGFVTYQNGIWVGLIVMAMGMSVLRWPVIYLVRWVRSRAGNS